MKRLPLYLSIWLSLMLAHAQAQNTVISNHFFQVTYQDEENWNRDEETFKQIDRIVQASIDHWEDLLANYAPAFDPSDPITVNLTIGDVDSVGAAKTHYTHVGPKILETNGMYYNTLSGAMDKLWFGNSEPSVQRTDIDITISHFGSYYFGEDASKVVGYDFHTIFLHELTHGMGFASVKYQSVNKQLVTNGATITPFDTLIDQGVSGKIEIGDNLEFGDTGLGVYNPYPGDDGSSFSHFDYYTYNDTLMKYSVDGEDVYRVLGAGELAVFEAMGYDLMPEPSTTLLAMLSIPALLLRRRRVRA